MSNLHGKNAVIYMGSNGSAAVNVAEMADWSIDFDSAFVDVSALNQTWKEFVKGMIGYSGSFNGNFNPASTILWGAAISNVAEKFYIYPTVSSPTLYYYGTAWFSLTKVVAGSTTSKAATGMKFQGTLALNYNGQ